MPVKLTKRTVDALTPPPAGKAHRYVFDTELPGFGLVVQPSGAKTFLVQYRTAGGRRGQKRRVTIGGYGALTVDEARGAARRMLADVARGDDPAAHRVAQKEAPLVRELGADYLADVDARKKPRTAAEYRRLWDKHVLPALGAAHVHAVTVAQVAALHRAMRPTPYAANRVLALLGAFFSYAEKHGARAKHTNPAHDVESYEEHARERFLTPAEVTKLGEALTRAATDGLPAAPTRRRKRKSGATAKHRPKSADTPRRANPFAVAAIRFLLLTGWREREALTLRWADLDLARRTATLPDTKTGKSVRALGAPALALLEELPRVAGSPYVFPGRTITLADGRREYRPLVEINRVWYATRHAASLGDVRLHDLRHSFASAIASAGGSLLMIRALLGHKDTKTTAKYAHLLDDPVKQVADNTAAQLAAQMAGGPRLEPQAREAGR